MIISSGMLLQVSTFHIFNNMSLPLSDTQVNNCSLKLLFLTCFDFLFPVDLVLLVGCSFFVL